MWLASQVQNRHYTHTAMNEKWCVCSTVSPWIWVASSGLKCCSGAPNLRDLSQKEHMCTATPQILRQNIPVYCLNHCFILCCTLWTVVTNIYYSLNTWKSIPYGIWRCSLYTFTMHHIRLLNIQPVSCGLKTWKGYLVSSYTMYGHFKIPLSIHNYVPMLLTRLRLC